MSDLSGTMSNNTLSIDQIKKKTVMGVSLLVGRTFLLQIVTFVATIILTAILSPAVYGTYFLVTAIIGVLNYFSDIGLAAALVQKKEEPTREDYITTFTLQQILVVLALIVLWYFSPSIVKYFNISVEGLWLLRALLISFFLSSLKTIPSIILERKLEFGLKVFPQVIETIVFYIVAVLLALLNFGILSFAYAALARGVAGVVSIYVIAPWPPSFGITKNSARKLLSFGIPFQGSSMLALVKDDLLTIFLGKILTKTEIGYIGWAKKWSELPLRSIMDNIIAVSFPVYSRIAHDKEVLKKGISSMLFFMSLFIFPATITLIVIMMPLVDLIPNYHKWQPALFSFYLFSFSAVMASLSSPLVQVLNSLGKVKVTFSLMVLWTALTWLFVPYLVTKYGFNGVSLAFLIISFSSFLPIILVKKHTNFTFFQSIYKPAICTLIMALFIFFISSISKEVMHVIIGIFSGIIVYTLLIYLWSKNEILPFIQLLIKPKPTT